MNSLSRPRFSCAALALGVCLADPASAEEPFFSEYVEGTSNNKALEIYNPAEVSVNLAGYSIQNFANGAATPTTTTALSGVIAPGGTFVIANPLANPLVTSVADQLSSNMSFNGNDTLVLLHSGTTVDVIGQVGFNPPGGFWGTNPAITTLDHTLRRKAQICTGDTNGSDPFEPSFEWDGFAVDSFGDLRSHIAACAPVVPALPPFGVIGLAALLCLAIVRMTPRTAGRLLL